MKTLLLISTLALGSAFAGSKAGLDKTTGDLVIKVDGQVAQTYFKNLDVTPETGIGTAKVKVSIRKGENITCRSAKKSKRVMDFFKESFYEADLKKWMECSMNIGSADPQAAEKICGKKPVNPIQVKYTCIVKIGKNGIALEAK